MQSQLEINRVHLNSAEHRRVLLKEFCKKYCRYLPHQLGPPPPLVLSMGTSERSFRKSRFCSRMGTKIWKVLELRGRWNIWREKGKEGS